MKYSISLLFFAIFLSIFLVNAQSHADERGATLSSDKPVYVVDVQRVIDQSQAGRAARSIVEEEAKKRQARLADLRREIETMQSDIDKQRSLLSQEALQEREAALRKKQKEAARSAQDQDDELSRKNSVEIERIVRRIDQVISQLVKESKYSIVVEKDVSLVVYVDPKYDVTEKVISMLDKSKDKS